MRYLLVAKVVARRVIGLLAVLASCAIVGVAIATEPTGEAPRPLAEFDISYNAAGCPRVIVPVSIAGRLYQFEISTNSLSSAFDIKHRHLLTARRLMAKLGRTSMLDTYRAPRMRLAAMSLPILNDAFLLDLSVFREVAGPLDGILGMDALANLVLRLDFDRHKVSFLPAVPADAGDRIGLVASHRAPMIVGAINGLGPREFVLATGACAEVTLNHTDFAALLGRRHLVHAADCRMTSIFDRATTRFAVLHVPFTVNVHSHNDLVLVEDSGVKAAPYNSLGLDYLSRYCTTFDFAQHAVYFKPGACYSALQPLYGLLGVRLVRHDGRLVAQTVLKGSVAHRFVRSGDVLESIDGARVQSMPHVEVVARLSNRNTAIMLVWRRSSDNTVWEMPLPSVNTAVPEKKASTK